MPNEGTFPNPFTAGAASSHTLPSISYRSVCAVTTEAQLRSRYSHVLIVVIARAIGADPVRILRTLARKMG
jgi:hypothetical protein